MGGRVNKNLEKRAGFTLIELLVVISIIGLLSSLGIVALNSARVKARDAMRMAEMAQLRTALNLYYDDNGHYPLSAYETNWNYSDIFFGATAQNGADSYLNDMVPAIASGTRPLMEKIPLDPKNPTNDPGISQAYLYRYITTDNGSEYAVSYYLEGDLSAPQHIRGW
jgi:prepilin-type N-terminal cleavage/methylation domain-containing protein